MKQWRSHLRMGFVIVSKVFHAWSQYFSQNTLSGCITENTFSFCFLFCNDYSYYWPKETFIVYDFFYFRYDLEF